MEDFLFYKMDSTYMPVVKFTNKVSVKPPHIHIKRQTEEFILYFVLSGEMYLKEGSREYALKPGDMLILDPHLVHCGTKASSCTYFYIHFYHDRMAECSGPEELVKNELVSSRLPRFRQMNVPSVKIRLPLFCCQSTCMSASQAL